MQPHRRQPTRLPHPWDSPGRILEWVAISFSNAWKWKVKVKSLSRVRFLATPWTAAYQAPPSIGFSRQEYWSGCHCLLRNKRSYLFYFFFYFLSRADSLGVLRPSKCCLKKQPQPNLGERVNKLKSSLAQLNKHCFWHFILLTDLFTLNKCYHMFWISRQGPWHPVRVSLHSGSEWPHGETDQSKCSFLPLYHERDKEIPGATSSSPSSK